MDCARPVLSQSTEVIRRSIAEVHIESVNRKRLGVFAHDPVSLDLRQDRRCSDARVLAVSFHDRLSLDARGRKRVSVDKRARTRDPLYSARQPKHRCAKNVSAIDLFNANDFDPPLRVATNALGMCLSRCCAEFLRIVQPLDREPRWQDDGRTHHGTGEGPAPGLVGAGDSGQMDERHRASLTVCRTCAIIEPLRRV